MPSWRLRHLLFIHHYRIFPQKTDCSKYYYWSILQFFLVSLKYFITKMRQIYWLQSICILIKLHLLFIVNEWWCKIRQSIFSVFANIDETIKHHIWKKTTIFIGLPTNHHSLMGHSRKDPYPPPPPRRKSKITPSPPSDILEWFVLPPSPDVTAQNYPLPFGHPLFLNFSKGYLAVVWNVTEN
jgi:hypothetical protein